MRTSFSSGLTPAILVSALAAVMSALLTRTAASQTEYYNLDANRPVRVEDAVPTERRSLDVEFAPLRFESFVGGTRRLRTDPMISYGVASLTEIELRIPILFVEPANTAEPAVIGFTNIGIGAMRALTTETTWVPALALAAEMLVPVGSLATPQGSYAIKGLLTKTTPWARLSINASYGTYSVAAAPPSPPNCALLPSGSPGCSSPPTIPDVPCSRVPVSTMLDVTRLPVDVEARPSTSACLTSNRSAAAPSDQRTVGSRWFAGAAIDHAFPLSSTLVVADVFAEHLIGLYPSVDWTAEIGVRRQWSMTVVVDAGISRHFLGSFPSTAFNFGISYAVAM
jgi:hypothetical protein